MHALRPDQVLTLLGDRTLEVSLTRPTQRRRIRCKLNKLFVGSARTVQRDLQKQTAELELLDVMPLLCLACKVIVEGNLMENR